ncbi:MAG: hypothetical protein GF331_12805 [Chitinivibrionales bacterium]|nr:hypothetical protein [Chitinivibrionales bacterium]
MELAPMQERSMKIIPFSMVVCAAIALTSTGLQAQAPEKRRVAVVPLEFAATTAGEYDGAAIAASLTDRINVGIAALGRFEVIERVRLNEILQEQALGQSGAIDEATAAQVGSITGVELVIVGSITSYSVTRVKRNDGSIRFRANLTLGVRFVDTETGEIRKATEIATSALDAAYETAEAKAQGKAVTKIIEEIRFLFPLSATVARVDGKTVYVTLGANMGLKPGMRFKTVDEGREIRDPNTDQLLGVEKVETGIIKIESVDEKFAKARILKDKKRIGVGDQVIEMRATTRFGITFAYGLAGLTGTADTVADTINYWAQDGSVLWDSVKAYGVALPPLSHWISIGIDVSEIQNTNLATQLSLMFLPAAGDLHAWLIDWNVSWNFPLVVDRLWVPVGAGAAVGRFSYDFPYGNELESRHGEWGIEFADADDRLYSWSFGMNAFAGLRLRVAKHLDAYVNGGYRFHFASSTWQVEYRTGETDESGQNKTERFDVEDRFCPYDDIALRGLDIRAGLTVGF